MNPTILINDGKSTITGRSIVDDRAIGPQAQETIPATENIRTLRAALNTLGDGFVEAIDDNTLIAIAMEQPHLSGGRVHGEVVDAPIFEAPGQTRVGRFGYGSAQKIASSVRVLSRRIGAHRRTLGSSATCAVG